MRAVLRLFLRAAIILSIVVTLGIFLCSKSFAFYDPLSVPNNRFGIHILHDQELNDAAQLVNSSGGDWGYAVIVIRANDRDVKKWQQFLNMAREKHIIPVVRIATESVGDAWRKPQEGDAQAWADFFSQLKWPTNNHYIIVYNEPNHAQEWGNSIDPSGYAREFAKTADLIKGKDSNAFILNAGFDAAAPDKPNAFMDETTYITEVDKAVPGIFKKIDGWSSHSYPQPNFTGSPTEIGRNTITTYRWEQQMLKEKFGVENIPVFITETGWQHTNDGTNKAGLSEDQVAQYFDTAFRTVWTDNNLVMVAPFTLSYDQQPFSPFSWIRELNAKFKVLGTQTVSAQFKQYQTVQAIPKTAGKPIIGFKAKTISYLLPKSAKPNSIITAQISVENTGEAVWFTDDPKQRWTFALIEGEKEQATVITHDGPIIPGQKYTLEIKFLSPQEEGVYDYTVVLKSDNHQVVAIPYKLTVTQAVAEQSFGEKVIELIKNILG